MRYTGQQQDPTGNYNLRARHYNPTRGAFTQTDPQPTGAGSSYEASYVYGGARPSVMVDPSGRRAAGTNVDPNLIAAFGPSGNNSCAGANPPSPCKPKKPKTCGNSCVPDPKYTPGSWKLYGEAGTAGMILFTTKSEEERYEYKIWIQSPLAQQSGTVRRTASPSGQAEMYPPTSINWSAWVRPWQYRLPSGWWVTGVGDLRGGLSGTDAAGRVGGGVSGGFMSGDLASPTDGLPGNSPIKLKLFRRANYGLRKQGPE